MGESRGGDLRVAFERRIRVQFQGAKVTSDAGLWAVRELDEALGLTKLVGPTLADTRTVCDELSRVGRNIQHDQVALLRQSVYNRLAGYEDTSDAGLLAVDAAMRAVVGRKDEKPVASTNTLSRFETQILSEPDNLEKLTELNSAWVARAGEQTQSWRIIRDLDSFDSPVHGQQEGSSYNGHFGLVCYHPRRRRRYPSSSSSIFWNESGR